VTRLSVHALLVAQTRPWGLVLGLLVVAALLVAVGMVALVKARRGR